MLFSKFFLSCGHIILGVRHDLEILLCKNTITRMTHMGNGNILQRKKKNIYSHKDNRRAHTNCGILSLVYPYFNCISELILIQVPAANHFLCNFHVIWIINKIGNAEQHLPRQLVCVVGPTELIGTGGKLFDQYCAFLRSSISILLLKKTTVLVKKLPSVSYQLSAGLMTGTSCLGMCCSLSLSYYIYYHMPFQVPSH